MPSILNFQSFHVDLWIILNKVQSTFVLPAVIVCISSLAMEFHEKLQSLAEKEGLRGRKVSRALESFSWNITILKVSNTHTHTHTHTHKPLLG